MKSKLITVAVVSSGWLGLLRGDTNDVVCPCSYIIKNVAELKARLSGIKDDRDVILWANGGVIKIMRYDKVEYEYIVVGQPHDGLPDPYENQPKPEYAKKQPR
jgi:hypothetical protein